MALRRIFAALGSKELMVKIQVILSDDAPLLGLWFPCNSISELWFIGICDLLGMWLFGYVISIIGYVISLQSHFRALPTRTSPWRSPACPSCSESRATSAGRRGSATCRSSCRGEAPFSERMTDLSPSMQ